MKDAQLARKLEALGLHTRLDFILHLPLRYEDETTLYTPAAAPPGRPVTVEAKVQSAKVEYRPKRQLIVRAEGLVLRFFNFYGSQLKAFQRAADEGLRVRAFGEVRGGWFGAEMAHPRYKFVESGAPLPAALTPVYPSTAGLSQELLRRRVLQALDAGPLDDTLPAAFVRRHGLQAFAASVEALHRPPPGTDLAALAERTHPAWRRIKFDELLAQQLSMKFAYRARRLRVAPVLSGKGPLLRGFMQQLPFTLTSAQKRALDDVLSDLRKPHPMQRLLQGDVGSGKTIVAALACLAAVDAGRQAAVMAPTEILSEQHYRKFSGWFERLGVRIGWLHGGVRKKERAAMLDAPIVIGTHALIQEGVDFDRLALAVVDEQHRFGVKQRLTFRRKAEEALPHQLMMSATPIPRTLAMTTHADLDLSVIDQLPPGRRPVSTRLAAAARRDEVLSRIRAACAEGEQTYWVCPVIEDSKDDDVQTAVATHEKLQRELGGLRTGLLHGRLPAAEKAAVMQSFSSGEIQLLVCTTVIEVGVDVPNASLMVIESAERFGLAQLHQLRGRVGRGAEQSYCVLMASDRQTSVAQQRLGIMEETSDGFRIAEKDLEIRGPGEVMGTRQSGVPTFRVGNLVRDLHLLEDARREAEHYLTTRRHTRETSRLIARVRADARFGLAAVG